MKHRIISAVLAAALLTVAVSASSCLRSSVTDGTDVADSSEISTNVNNETAEILSKPDEESTLEPQTEPATVPNTDSVPDIADPVVSVNNVITQGTSVDNAAYDIYDNTLIGWGSGGSVNDRNQPVGCVVYNNKYGSYNATFMADSDKNIYLTFDEGYENGYTESILNTLRDKGVKAVFFVTYDYASRNQDLVRRIIDDGHLLGSHSKSHLSLPSMSASEVSSEITDLHWYVKENFGYEMNLFRPPMGEFSERTLAVTRDLGYESVFWSFAHRDWVTDDQPDPQSALEKATNALHPGAIYLLHAVSSTNAAILGDLIDNARSAGYVVARLDQ